MLTYAADLAPFRVPVFRRYLLASSLGFSSIWIYLTVAAWMLLELTGSAAAAGLMLIAMTIPAPFSMLVAGPLIDRLGPRTIAAVAYCFQGSAALMTGILALTGEVSIPLALVFAFMLGTADGFVIVSSQVLAGRSVPVKAMSAAITLSLLAIGVGRIVGAPIGGAVSEIAGPGVGLMLAGAGFLLAGGLILTIPRMAGTGGGARVSLNDLREGLAWVRATRVAIVVIALGAVAALLVWSYLGLLAPHSRDVLGGDSGTLGLITAVGGIGAITAALTAGPAARTFGSVTVLIAAVVGGGLVLVAFGLSTWVPVAMLLSVMLSFALMLVSTMGSLTLQSAAPLELRGRVLAINGFVLFGLMPVSIALAGMAADIWGVTTVMVTMGSSAFGLAIAIALMAYRRNILPQPRAAVPVAEPTTASGPGGLRPPDQPLQAEPSADAAGPTSTMM